MKYLIVLSLILLLASRSTSAATLRGPEVSRSRHLDEVRDFVPLVCNADLASAFCESWSSKFGTENEHSDRITIDCGTCVTMDHAGDTLSLLNGLEIYGKLVFPEGYRLTVEATMISVQGELEMTASKPVDGVPQITLIMVGDNDETFTPIGENREACDGESSCDTGKSGIVVAGGKVNINGLPFDTKSWVRLYDVDETSNEINAIIVEDTVRNKWVAGAEILITSHTRVWNEHQERTITAVSDATETGYVRLDLNEPILRPTTIKESSDFAVEVALLSRNIVFQTGNESPGGHFMIMNTPTVKQTIQGIELKGFGQQGTLGKYPIHFHFCGKVDGSIVAKNTVRQSNQRCVVVHGTDNLRIEENVAFDTKGHCFITEDGMETGNEFFRNLGAQTSIPDKIIPDEGPNGKETDDQPATFWITSTRNSFLENVAAGSEHSGYWFEPLLRGTRAHLYPDLKPMIQPLTLFQDNVAHSNNRRLGAVRMYQPGYLPETIATISGLKSYRNNGVGISLHKNHNIVLTGGLFADNSVGIDIDRAQGIDVRDTVIIGESESYRQLLKRQTVDHACVAQRMVGLDLHTWKLQKDRGGVTLKDVQIIGFGTDTLCEPVSIHLDQHTLEQGQFELFTSFERVSLDGGGESISFCDAETLSGINSVYLIDLDGGLSPSTVSTQKTSTIISNGAQMQKFVDPEKCTDVPVGCHKYCTETCFRSIRYEIRAESTDGHKLKVCKNTDSSNCSLFSWGRREGHKDPRTFIAHLPVGYSYNAVFLDDDDKEVMPMSVLEEYEESLCPGDEEFSVKLVDELPDTPPSVNPPPIPQVETQAPTKAPLPSTITKPPTKPPASWTDSPTNTPIMRGPPTPAPSATDSEDNKVQVEVPTTLPARSPTDMLTLTVTPTPAPSSKEDSIQVSTKIPTTSAPSPTPMTSTGSTDPSVGIEPPSTTKQSTGPPVIFTVTIVVVALVLAISIYFVFRRRMLTKGGKGSPKVEDTT